MSKSKDIKTISVFIASPSDLASERRQFRDAIEQLNLGFADGAGVEFEALGWEDTLATAGRRNQSVINQDIDRCDVFILAMHRRWGQPAPDATPYSSYTEEEFHRALERWKKENSPEIFVFFKRVDPGQEADPGVELQKVLQFRQQLEDTRQILYRYIDDTPDSFLQEVDRHLRAFVKGELPAIDSTGELIVLPLAAIEEVKKAKAEVARLLKCTEDANKNAEAALLRAEELALEMAEEASNAALEGRLEYARQKFARATDGTTNNRILLLAFQFYYRTGDFNTAQEMLERSLSLTDSNSVSPQVADTIGSLGISFKTHGDLDRAEAMHKKALVLNEALGREEGMADNYGNLGLVYETRGDLDQAEVMHKKALELDEALGRKEGMAGHYGNLGLVYRIRGDLDQAEVMHKKALELDVALGWKEGMAGQYGNLGNVYFYRGDLDQAEKMHQKALELDKILGTKEGIADDYSNLGAVYRARGDRDQTEAMYQLALELYSAIGLPNSEQVRNRLQTLRD